MDAPLRPAAAAFSMLLAMAIIGVIDNLIPVIAQDVGLWQFLILRAAIAVPIIVAAGWVMRARLRPISFRAVALRSTWVALAMFVYFGALAVLPIQEALAGLFTSPVFVLLITAFFYGDRVGPWRIAAVAIGFAGVLVVLQPGNLGQGGWMALIPALGGFFYALSALATRRSCAFETTFTMLLGVMLAQAVGATLVLSVPNLTGAGDSFLTRAWVWDIGDAFWLIVIQAVGSSVGVGLIIRAYQWGETSYVAIYEYSVFFFAPIIAWVMFRQEVTLTQGIGIAMIVLAGSLIALRSREVAT